MKPLVWLGIALIVAWGVLWLGIKMAVFAVHLLLLIGVALIGWGLLHRGMRAARRHDRSRITLAMRDLPPDLPESVVQAHRTRARQRAHLCFRRGARHRASEARQGILLSRAGPASRSLTPTHARAHPHAGDSTGVDRRVDLRHCARAPAGQRSRCARSQAVSLPPAMERGARQREVRSRVVAFAESFCAFLRRCLRRDLARPTGFPRSKVLAIAVAVLAETLIRVGNTEYARNNRSYGLTTLRNRHVNFMRGGRARQVSRQRRAGARIGWTTRLVRIFRHIQQLPGQALFQYAPTTVIVCRSIRAGQSILAEAMGGGLAPRISAPGARPCAPAPGGAPRCRTSCRWHAGR